MAKAKTAASAKPAAPSKLAGKAKPAARKAAAGKAKPSTRQKPGGWGRAEGKPKFRAAPRPVAEAEAPPKPVPVIPAELLDDGPKVKKPRKPRGKKADAPKPVGALDVILQQLDDSKAQQVVTISLEEKKAVADAMVVASGTSNRHVGAIADQLDGPRPKGPDGIANIHHSRGDKRSAATVKNLPIEISVAGVD